MDLVGMEDSGILLVPGYFYTHLDPQMQSCFQIALDLPLRTHHFGGAIDDTPCFSSLLWNSGFLFHAEPKGAAQWVTAAR